MKKQTNNYEFHFNMSDKVKVKDLAIKGKINGIFITKNSIEYRVHYFADSKPVDSYFEFDELELYKGDEVGLGFKENK